MFHRAKLTLLCCLCSFYLQSLTVSEIDEELFKLKQQLKDYQLKAVDEQVQGQGLMIADWAAYSQDIQKIKEDELHIRQIKEQIKQLEQKKAQLQQSTPSH